MNAHSRLIKWISVWLAVAILFSMAACSSSTMNRQEHTRQALVVETAMSPYSDGMKIRVAERLTEAFKNYYLLLRTEEEFGTGARLFMKSFIREQILPILEAQYMTEDELDALCFLLEENYARLASAEKMLTGEDVALWFGDFYRGLSSIIGMSRAGSILYDGTALWLDQRVAHYEELSSSRNDAADAHMLSELKRLRVDLDEKLGEELFSDMVGFLMFGGNLFTGVLDDYLSEDSNSISFNDAELKMLLTKQASCLDTRAVTVEQWQVICRVLYTWIPNDISFDDPVRDLVVKPFLHDENADRIANLLPCLATLYEDVLHHVTVEDVARFRNEDNLSRLSVISHCLVHCESSTRNLLEALYAFLSETSVEADSLLEEQGDKKSFNEFSDSLEKADLEDVMQALCRMDTDATQASA